VCCGIAKQSLTSGQVVLEGQFNHIVSKAEIEMGAVPSPFIVGTLSCEAKSGGKRPFVKRAKRKRYR